MSHSRFPEGWDEQRVRELLTFYAAQSEDEAVAEDEAGVSPSDTVMNIPHDLVPIVRDLIAKRQG